MPPALSISPKPPWHRFCLTFVIRFLSLFWHPNHVEGAGGDKSQQVLRQEAVQVPLPGPPCHPSTWHLCSVWLSLPFFCVGCWGVIFALYWIKSLIHQAGCQLWCAQSSAISMKPPMQIRLLSEPGQVTLWTDQDVFEPERIRLQLLTWDIFCEPWWIPLNLLCYNHWQWRIWADFNQLPAGLSWAHREMVPCRLFWDGLHPIPRKLPCGSASVPCGHGQLDNIHVWADLPFAFHWPSFLGSSHTSATIPDVFVQNCGLCEWAAGQYV